MPVNVEVWNATSNQLLARSQVPPTNGVTVVPVRFGFRHYVPGVARYSGWGPFRILSVPNAPQDRLEVRVWTPPGGDASVYDISLRRISVGH